KSAAQTDGNNCFRFERDVREYFGDDLLRQRAFHRPGGLHNARSRVGTSGADRADRRSLSRVGIRGERDMGAVAARAALPVRWRPVLRAMSQTGGSSLASGLLSLAATKILAVMLGPAQVALLATLQQIRQTALTGATLNGQTALIQGASAT